MKKHYSSQVTKSHRFIAKALFVVFGMMLWMPHQLKAQEVILKCPENRTVQSCLTQAEVDSQFADWLLEFSFDGGCVGASGDFLVIPVAPPACGGSETVTYQVSDGCEPANTVFCERTFTVSPPTAFELTVPFDFTVTTCMTEEEVNTDFSNWLSQASATGGCDVTLTNNSSGAPSACGGFAEVTWTATSSCQIEPLIETSIFTVSPPAVDLTVPDDYTGTTCITQEAVNTAFDDWLAEAGLTGGCGAQMTWFPDNPTAPDLCGGSTTVTWTVTSDCEDPVTETRTFTIPDAPAVVLTVPENYDGTTCMTQAEVNEAYTTWLASANFTGGCEGLLTNNAPTDAPSFCGGSVTVEWTVTSNCEVPVVKSAIFTIPAAPSVALTVPANYDGTTCMTQEAVSAAFTSWLAEAQLEGGCGGILTRVPENPTAPEFCGGSTTVTWTVTSDCEEDVVQTRTFTIPDAPAVALTVPENYDGTTCMTQAEVDEAYTTWLAGASFTGGCEGLLTSNAPTEAPSFCGGSITVTWTVTSGCGDNVVKSAIFAIPNAPEVTTFQVPDDITYYGCYTEAQIQVNYNDWLELAEASGGCGLDLTHNAPANAPDNCGGSVEVTWTITSNCHTDLTESSVFTVVNNPDAITFNTLPEDTEMPIGSTQDDVNTNFDAWLQDVTWVGGCNPVLTNNSPGPPSACGGSVEVTWTVISDCEVKDSESRTFSVPYSPLLYDNIVSDENPHAPLIDYYDGRGTAYMTIGGSGESEDNPVHWSSANWIRCLQDGRNIGNPTPYPVDNAKNDIYLQISAGDFIKVDKVSYQNNITLVVCGYLEIGEFSVEEEGGAYLNNVKIIICEGGFLKATTLELMNNVFIYNDGTLQAGRIYGQASNSDKCITGTGDFQDLYGNTIIEQDLEEVEWFYNNDYLINGDWWTFGVGCNSGGVAAPLPVELLSFDHKVYPDHIQIQWITASELNNDFFTIERSTDARIWEIVGYKPGAGTTSEIRQYRLNDHDPVNGLSYYRLKQTDFDGQYEYFRPISVSYAADQNELDFRIVKNKQQWTIYVTGDGEYNIELYSLTGQKLYSGNITGELTLPAPQHAVVVRIFSPGLQSVSRVVM